MSWNLYYSEICKAKDEYDRTVRPIVEALEHIHKEAWEKYLTRIKQAELFLEKEEES